MANKSNDITKLSHYYAILIIDFIRSQGSIETFTIEDIASYFSYRDEDTFEADTHLKFSQLTDAALKFLEKKKLIELLEDDYGPDLIAVDPQFSQNLSLLVNEVGSPYRNYFIAKDNKKSWIFQAVSRVNDAFSENASGQEAIFSGSDVDEWSPISIDRDDPKLTDAISSVENAVKAIEENNGYAATHPEERNGIVENLKGSLAAIKKGSLPKDIIINSILVPLKYISKRFGDSIVGEAARLAVKAVASWLGIS